jgi:hypothetical protein
MNSHEKRGWIAGAAFIALVLLALLLMSHGWWPSDQ